MINIVVYGDNNTILSKCINSIDASLFDCGINYQIDRYNEYSKKMKLVIKNKDKKIYILDNDSDESGLRIAYKIRKNDYDSIIIMIGKCYIDLSMSRVMLLDYVCLGKNFENRLIDDIGIAVSIIDKSIDGENNNFIFEYKRVLYKIPFNDITYIEKESNIKRCIIHTINNDSYYITDSLNSIMERLVGDFYRSHQSCIINLSNIRVLELGNNMVIFKNGDMTDMVTCSSKKEIKKYIGVS